MSAAPKPTTPKPTTPKSNAPKPTTPKSTALQPTATGSSAAMATSTAAPTATSTATPTATSTAAPTAGFWTRLRHPRGLFWKIFGWFLAAQALIGLALFLLASATQRGFDQRFSEMIGVNLEYRARAAAIAYENGGPSALREVWQSGRGAPVAGSNAGPNAGPNGAASGIASGSPTDDGPVFGDGPPPDALDGPPDVNDGGFGGGGPDRRGPNDLEASSLYALRAPAKRPANLVARHLIGPRTPFNPKMLSPDPALWPDTFVGPNGATFLLRHVETARGGRYAATLRLRSESQGPRRVLENWLGGGRGGPGAPARFAVIVLTMGALCYVLARYLTDPALKLRRATRQFAAGDFAARVGPQMGARRDELADLGHDFDQMAERIEGLLLAQRQLLGDISHELRSPLTRLSLALELATQSADPPTRALLERIEGEAGEMNRLIGGLLTLAQLENGAHSGQQTSREAAYIDLAHLAEHVASNADFEARSRGGSVEITHSEAAEIVGNGELLHSALENVVRNAILHSSSAPRVEVSLHVEKRGAGRIARVRVRDYGPGVPEAALDAMFRPFFRVDAARTRGSGGTGLGLSIAQRAARFHGGDVSARNADGGGLEVEISLPLGEAPLGEAPLGEAPLDEAPLGEAPLDEAPLGEAPEVGKG